MLNQQQTYKLLERFLHYTTYDTQSKSGAKISPSSAGQLKLAKHLQQELFALGLQDIDISKHSVVTAFFLPMSIQIRQPLVSLRI